MSDKKIGDVGYTFRKKFDEGWFEGTVAKIRKGAGELKSCTAVGLMSTADRTLYLYPTVIILVARMPMQLIDSHPFFHNLPINIYSSRKGQKMCLRRWRHGRSKRGRAASIMEARPKEQIQTQAPIQINITQTMRQLQIRHPI